MPHYRLIYSDVRGWAETSRLLFALAGVEYEDIRVREGWPGREYRMPFGHKPLLEVDGTLIGGGMLMANFVAKQFGMSGKGDTEEALVESYVSKIYELCDQSTEYYKEEDEAKRPEVKKKFKEEILPNVFQKFEDSLSGNLSGYLVGDSITVADVALFDHLAWLRVQTCMALTDTDIAAYPKILEHERKLQNLPKISEWIAKRPKTVY